MPDETGAQIASKGFASAVAEQLASELKERARRKGAAEGELQRIERLCLEAGLAQWTEVVPDSDADAYGWEVRESDEPRLKRAVKPEFFAVGWFEAHILAPRMEPNPSIVPPPTVAPFGPGSTVPPPPTLPVFQYYLVVNGQRSGPHVLAHVQHWIAAGQLAATVLAWRDGLSGWVPLNQVPELASLFATVAPPPFPGGEPPPIPGPKAAE